MVCVIGTCVVCTERLNILGLFDYPLYAYNDTDTNVDDHWLKKICELFSFCSTIVGAYYPLLCDN